MSTSKELSSSEKKRLRDRRAQRKLRERRDCELKLLQQELADCRRLHNPDNIQRLAQRVRTLEEENETLRSRQKQLQSLLHSWNPIHMSSPLPNTPMPEIHQCTHQPGPSHGMNSAPDNLDPALAVKSSSLVDALSPPAHPSTEHGLLPLAEFCLTAAAVAQPPKSMAKRLEPVPPVSGLVATSSGAPPISPHMLLSLEMLPPLVPAWMLSPADEDPRSAVSMSTSPWLSRPDLIAECPDLPSPLDLLHGSHRNFLANSIHESLRHLHCRDPEVLAMGWLVYVYAKWRISPSPATFAKIPPCMRPVMGQLQKTHPSCLDQIIWPQLRLNMMHFCPREKLVDVMRILSCCLKVRWKWGEDILEWDDNDDLQIRPSFFDTFMAADGWGITLEFIETHPDLVDGLDLSQVLHVPI